MFLSMHDLKYEAHFRVFYPTRLHQNVFLFAYRVYVIVYSSVSLRIRAIPAYSSLLAMLGEWATELKLHTYGVRGFNTRVHKQPSIIQSPAL